MTAPLVVALAQSAFRVGAVAANAERIVELAEQARDALGAALVAFPELALTGYPPDDLLLRQGMPAAVKAGLARIAAVRGITIVVGHPDYAADGRVYNAASALRDGALLARARKQHLPANGVFDEPRHFTPGEGAACFDCQGQRIGLLVCEDLWHAGPARAAALDGATLLLGINASPYEAGKFDERCRVLTARVTDTHLPLLYVNLVGGQDELLFDGESLGFEADGRLSVRAPACIDGLHRVEVGAAGLRGPLHTPAAAPAGLYQALVRALRDYVDGNGFPGAVLGLSGGIDSALVAALAVDALGAERVTTVALPSRYTADISNDDAAEQAALLGCRHLSLPIGPAVEAFEAALAPAFAGREPDLTEENLQARARGVLLMALSNKFGQVVLATGNKSEMAVGYSTLYGDMCGGFAPIKDVYKTDVYALARWRNTQGRVIPERVIERAPSAELRPEQTDQDSLPPYDVLDAILQRWVEQGQDEAGIVAAGFDAATVSRVAGLVRRAEYKRRQAAPGPKLSARAFGRDRRYPITADYDGL